MPALAQSPAFHWGGTVGHHHLSPAPCTATLRLHNAASQQRHNQNRYTATKSMKGKHNAQVIAGIRNVFTPGPGHRCSRNNNRRRPPMIADRHVQPAQHTAHVNQTAVLACCQTHPASSLTPPLMTLATLVSDSPHMQLANF